jgi:hypothetical protein
MVTCNIKNCDVVIHGTLLRLCYLQALNTKCGHTLNTSLIVIMQCGGNKRWNSSFIKACSPYFASHFNKKILKQIANTTKIEMTNY